MTEDDFYLLAEFPLALRVSAILCHTPRQKQLDELMGAFKPYLKELYHHQRRSKLKRVK